jgi:polysaccharide biosynthesis/export protein
MLRSLFLAIVLLFGVGFSAAAQVNQLDEPRQVILQAAPAGPPAVQNLWGFSTDYEVGPGDLIEIQVVGHEDLHQRLRVSYTGEVSVPMLGLVAVLDKTAFEIEEEIARLLREKALVRQPEVLVFVQEYHAKPIYVMGAVTTPGELIMSQALTTNDAILLSGGLAFNAGDEGLLYRRGSSPETANISPASLAANPGAARPGVEVVKVDLRPLKSGRFQDSAISLRRGDVLVVPNLVLKQFFVAGEVLAPRNYMYAPGKTLMATQAISWAGGPTRTAKMSQGMLVRFDEQGRRTELKVDWAAIMNGKQQDFPIQPNDIIFVPGSAVKTIAQGMLLLTDTMVMTTSFRIARTYQMPDAPEMAPRPPQ